MSIPLHLITGFLGSGKSTFVKQFLHRYNGSGKIAIVQNEFSPISIDGSEFRAMGNYQVLEINNGSAFCICLLGAFIKSLATFIDKVKPDIIVMEASGLSDPIGVGEIFQSELLKKRVYLEHIWCLVDAMNFNRLSPLMNRIERQLRSADTIVINKTDLAGDDAGLIHSYVRKVNPFASVLTGSYGKVELNFNKAKPNFYPVTNESSMSRPDIESVVLRSNLEIDIVSLKKFLQKISVFAVRCKGFVKLDNGKNVFIQSVFSEYSIKEVMPFIGGSEFVVIGTFGKGEDPQRIYNQLCKYDDRI